MAPDQYEALKAPLRRHNVPNEILLLIFRQLHKEDLKSIRLVCKLWSSLPVGLLFDRVYVSPHSVNIIVFNSIAAHPLLSKCIKELVYDTSCFDANLTRSAYLTHLYYQLTHGCTHLQPDFTFDTVDDQLNEILQYTKDQLYRPRKPTDDVIWEEMCNYRLVDCGYQAYLESAKQQREYHDSGELLANLTLGLKNLLALDAVVLLGRTWGQRLTDCGFDHTTLRPTHMSGSPLARSWNPLFLEPRLINRRAQRHLEFFTIIRGLSLSHRKISRFETGPTLEIYQTTFDTKALMSPSLLHHTVNALSEVSSLSLQRITTELGHDTKSIDALPTILRSMSTLKHLSLDLDKISDGNNGPYKLAEIFGPHRAWPHLISLCLGSFAADETNLLDFLTSLCALQDLALRDVELTSGNWTSALEQLRRSLKLRRLSLEPPLSHFGGIEIWAFDDWIDDPMKEKIERFFRDGGDNPFRTDS